ncbi:MAG: hypothetical protein AB1659_01785 [Thermodesulfobacteriota bacterium]
MPIVSPEEVVEFIKWLSSIDWISGDERVALELGFFPSGVLKDSYSMQVSFQCRWILAAEFLFHRVATLKASLSFSCNLNICHL